MANSFDPNKFLSSGIFPEGEKVSLVTTHISYVFIGEEIVYKVKRPVDFGFLDFTTLEKRKFYCEKEVELNRRASPEIYLGVRGIFEEGGLYNLDGRGSLVDYAVVMRRMDLDRMMDKLLLEGKLTEEDIVKVSEKISQFHKIAETNEEILSYGGIEKIRINTDENFQQIAGFIGNTISKKLYDYLKDWTEFFYRDKKDLFQKRVKKKKIRDCHGDLYSRNICIMDKVYLYDCIEFNDRFRYIDTSSDLAFLLMDLEYYGRGDFSKLIFERYLRDMCEEDDFWDITNFYKVYRAVVRGKIHSFMGSDDPSNYSIARRYFLLAGSYSSWGKRLVIFMGPTGVGKSTYAEKFSNYFHADYLNTDLERKRIFNIPIDEHHFDPFGKGLYSPEKTSRVYESLLEKTRKLLESHSPIIVLDGTFLTYSRRRPFIELAREKGAEVIIVFPTPSDEVVKRRLEERLRKRTVSDGRWEIYVDQKRVMEPPKKEEGKIIEISGEEEPEKLLKMIGEELCLI